MDRPLQSYRAGDTFFLRGSGVDDRTLWQRFAPKWLGGKDDPTMLKFYIIRGETASND